MGGQYPDWTHFTVETNRNTADTGTRDFTAEGVEIEISYNPTSKWTIFFTVARQETITSNTYPVMTQYVNDFVIPNWVNNSFAQTYFIDEDATTTLAKRAQNLIVDPVLQAKTGGGVRWEDEVGIGFGVAVNELGNMALDTNQPFYGPSQTFIDVFARTRYELTDTLDLILQLNIKDLTNHDGLVPFYAEPNGMRLYRFLEGRLITLSATLSF